MLIFSEFFVLDVARILVKKKLNKSTKRWWSDEVPIRKILPNKCKKFAKVSTKPWVYSVQTTSNRLSYQQAGATTNTRNETMKRLSLAVIAALFLGQAANALEANYNDQTTTDMIEQQDLNMSIINDVTNPNGWADDNDDYRLSFDTKIIPHKVKVKWYCRQPDGSLKHMDSDTFPASKSYTKRRLSKSKCENIINLFVQFQIQRAGSWEQILLNSSLDLSPFHASGKQVYSFRTLRNRSHHKSGYTQVSEMIDKAELWIMYGGLKYFAVVDAI